MVVGGRKPWAQGTGGGRRALPRHPGAEADARLQERPLQPALSCLDPQLSKEQGVFSRSLPAL